MARGSAVLPDTFGRGLLRDVIRIPGNYTAVLPYRTDEQALQAFLPSGLTLTGGHELARPSGTHAD